MRTPVSDEPASTRRTFLTTLYTHLTLSVGACVLSTVVLAQPAQREFFAGQHLLLLPLATMWGGSLAGFARARGHLKTVLGAVAHAAAAGLVGVALTAVLKVAKPHDLARALFTLWSSVVGSLVAILAAPSDSITGARLTLGAASGGTASTLALAYLNAAWAQIPVTLLAVAVLHALLIRDPPHLPRLMKRVGADEAALAAQGLGSSWILRLLLGLCPEDEEHEKGEAA